MLLCFILCTYYVDTLCDEGRFTFAKYVSHFMPFGPYAIIWFRGFMFSIK